MWLVGGILGCSLFYKIDVIMDMVIKKYRHITKTFAMYHFGELGVMSFEHGRTNPVFQGGVLVSGNTAEQEAIEAHKGFDVDFFLESVNGKYVSRTLADAKNGKNVSEVERLSDELAAMHNKYNSLLAEHESLKLQMRKLDTDDVKTKDVVDLVEDVDLGTVEDKVLEEEDNTSVAWQTAKKMLVEDYGIDADDVKTKAAVIEKIDQIGLDVVVK